MVYLSKKIESSLPFRVTWRRSSNTRRFHVICSKIRARNGSEKKKVGFKCSSRWQCRLPTFLCKHVVALSSPIWEHLEVMEVMDKSKQNFSSAQEAFRNYEAGASMHLTEYVEVLKYLILQPKLTFLSVKSRQILTSLILFFSCFWRGPPTVADVA